MGTTVTGIAAANLDSLRGNSFVDLLVADLFNGGVRWLEGRGTGAFQLRDFSDLGAKVAGVAVADLDSDGIVDACALDRESSTLAVAFGRGDGTFASPVKAVIGGDLRAITTVDTFVAVADAAANQVVLAEVGPGAVLSIVNSLEVGEEPVSLAAGDFDGNGLGDLVVGSRAAGNVTLLRQGGDRVFSAVATLPVGPGVSAVALGDVNADGTSDLLVGQETGELVVFRNNAQRSFTRVFTGQLGLKPVAMYVVDDRSPGQVATGDGRADALVLNRASNDVAMLAGRGDGSFQVSSRLVVGHDPVALAVGNFDEDPEGAVDFATANQGMGSVSIVAGQGGGAFVAAVSFGTGPDTAAFTVADFDRDGWLDVVTLNRGDGTVSFLRGNGRGNLRPRQDFAGRVGATLLASGDFNGDGFVDLALAAQDDPHITILPNGIAGFGLSKTMNVEVGIALLRARDLDFDGRADLLALQPGAARILVLRGGVTSFETPKAVDFQGLATSMSVAQVVGDTNIDLLLGLGEPPSLLVFEGLGGGDFGQPQSVPLPHPPTYLAVDDFIPDGISDIAVLSSDPGRLYLLQGDAAGNFSRTVEDEVAPGAVGLAAADLNGNGVPDLVTCDPRESIVRAFSSDGSGRFAKFQFAVGRGPTDLTVADLNTVSDATHGLAEVVSLNSEANTVTVLRNITRATARAATPTPTVGPGTPPPPEPPTPLPTRTRPQAGKSDGSAGCAVVTKVGGVGPLWGLMVLTVASFWRRSHRCRAGCLRPWRPARRVSKRCQHESVDQCEAKRDRGPRGGDI